MPTKVLLIDDDLILARSLERMLRLGGFAVTLANSGAAALARIDEIRPELVLCDYQMPAMDGIEVTREIARRSPEVRCILMSGSIEIDEATAGIPVLLKPFDLDDVAAVLS